MVLLPRNRPVGVHAVVVVVVVAVVLVGVVRLQKAKQWHLPNADLSAAICGPTETRRPIISRGKWSLSAECVRAESYGRR